MGSNQCTGPDAQALLDLLAGRATDIELDRASLEIARIEYPELDAGAFIGRLDDYAAAIAERARDLSDGESFLEAANGYLFGEVGLKGNQDDYYNADNSYLNRVLERRLGIPISLSVVYIEVARRLAKPVVGVGLPGHFIVRYDDGKFASFLDPFHGGTLLDEAGCWELAQVERPDASFLEPVDRRSIAMRMINNLRQIYFSGRQPEKALRVLDLLIAADPDGADEHKQRGVALMQLERTGEALRSFRRYLELAPEAADRETIVEQVKNLAFWMASRN